MTAGVKNDLKQRPTQPYEAVAIKNVLMTLRQDISMSVMVHRENEGRSLLALPRRRRVDGSIFSASTPLNPVIYAQFLLPHASNLVS
jgi:hypothetical protein